MFCDTTPPIPINGIDPDVRPDMVRFVVVAYELFKSVMVPEAEDRSLIVALDIVVVARVEVPVTTKVLVVVELVVVRLVMKEVTALNIEAKRLVDVEFVEDEFVVKKLVEVLLVVMRLIIVAEATVRSEMVVVANCDVPVALKVPVVRDVNDELEETLRVLFDQRRLEPAVIRVCGEV